MSDKTSFGCGHKEFSRLEHRCGTSREQSTPCYWVVFPLIRQSVRTPRCFDTKFVERGLAVQVEAKSLPEFQQRDLADGMQSLSKLPADVVSKSFQELFMFAVLLTTFLGYPSCWLLVWVFML